MVLAVGALVTASLTYGLWQSARPYGWERLECTIDAARVEEHPEAKRADQELRVAVSYHYVFRGRSYTSSRLTIGNTGSADAAATRRLESRYPQGALVPCWVDPQQPEQAVLERVNLWSGFALLGPLLIVAVAAGGLFLLWRRPSAGLAETLAGRVTRQPIRPRFRLVSILPALLGLVMAAALAGFFLRPAVRTVAARSWPTSTCLIRASQVRTDTSRRRVTYSADILYSYEVGGRQYESNRYDFLGGGDNDFSANAAIAARYRPGTRVDCYVDPKDPTEAVLARSFRPAYLFGLIPLVLLLVIVVSGAQRLRRRA